MEEEHGGERRGEEMRVEGKEGRSMGKRGEDTEMKVEGMEWGRSMGRTGGGGEKGVGRREGNKPKEISLLCSQVCFHVPVIHAECKKGRTKLCVQVCTYVEISCNFMLV